jgi:hypothetical protein
VDYFFNAGFSLGLGGTVAWGDHPENTGFEVAFRANYRFNESWSLRTEFHQFNNTDNVDSFGGFPNDGSSFVLAVTGHFF